MSRVRAVALVVALVLGSAMGASAPCGEPAPAAEALAQQETDARAKSAIELLDLVKFCSTKASWDEARRACANALEFTPDDAAIKAEAARLEKKKGVPRPLSGPQVEDRRAKSLAKCTALMSPVALAYAQGQRTDDLNRMLMLLRAVGAPPPDLDIAYFEPYLDWHTKAETSRLVAGCECIDGVWLEPPQVAELDKAHTDWANPWTVSDDACEVRTTLPLRTAKQVLANAAAIRRIVLRYFAGEWDLKQPAIKLRIVVTQSRSDMDMRVHVDCPTAPSAPHDPVAYYVDSPDPGNPCFLCFEVLDAKDKATKLDFKGVQHDLQREVARQVAFEYSKHVKGQGRMVHAAAWTIEGFAEFAPYLAVAGGACVVTHPSWIPSRGREVDSAFGWCRTNIDSVPPLDEFCGMPRLKFVKNPDNARVAATLVWYLLEGNRRARRAGFVKYLVLVHQDRDESGAFQECLGVTAPSQLDPEFRAFVKGIRIDEK